MEYFNQIKNPRARAMYIMALAVFAVFFVRLFYLQVIRYSSYNAQALASQQKNFVIKAKRGEVYLSSKEGPAPLVLNETLHTVWVDPKFIKDIEGLVDELAPIIRRHPRDLIEQINANKNKQYLEVATEISVEEVEKLEEKELSGVGVNEYTKRIYPEGKLASHVLGYVNVDGEGQYGLEQYYDEEIGGQDGIFKAVTDTNGIPLRASDDNVLVDPVHGSDALLTIDRTMQYQLEAELLKHQNRLNAENISAIVMNPENGDVLAMANYPDYHPGSYAKIAQEEQQTEVFNNKAVSSPYEPGSVIKPFTAALAFDSGLVDPNGSWYDSGREVIDEYEITNTTDYVGDRPVSDIIKNSVNTGTIYMLRQMGNGKINFDAKQALYQGFTDKFRLDKKSGIDLANEVEGSVADPAQASTVQYANMTFGQGITSNLTQLSIAYSSLVNGGTIYRPRVVKQITEPNQAPTKILPQVLSEGTITNESSADLQAMLAQVVEGSGLSNSINKQGYTYAGKTGSAQIPSPTGGYLSGPTIGSFIGHIDNGSGEKYVIVVRVDRARISGFTGSGAAYPIFADYAQWLTDYLRLAPEEGR